MNQINIPREFETSSMVCLQRETTDFYAGAKLEGGCGGCVTPPPQSTNHLDWQGKSSGLAGQ